MTTRAGTAGLLTGLIASLAFYLLLRWPAASIPWSAAGLLLALLPVLLAGGGWWAAGWSRSIQPARCAALGALSGALAGTTAFCLFGAALAGELIVGFNQLAATAGSQPPPGHLVAPTVSATAWFFLAFFLCGGAAGALGGWLAHPKRSPQPDRFDKEDPQMALNGALTAVPASIAAAALAATVFSRLGALIRPQTGQTGLAASLVWPPLGAALLLVLVSQFALLLVVPHEARQAEHLCGLDEVKMAASIAVGAAPALILLLFLINRGLFLSPSLLAALLASLGMSLIGLYMLLRVVLPRRAAFPPHPPGRQQTEALLFGTIARSRGPRLALLCIGCGLLMVLPTSVAVVAPLINLSAPGRLFQLQALASLGLAAAASAALTIIYWFYLNLGRWFSRRNSPPR